MNARMIKAVAGSVLVAGTLTVAQSPANATTTTAPAPATATTSVAVGQPLTSPRDYRQGYRDGFRDGWRMAREDCNRGWRTFRGGSGNRDYERGYNRGFSSGFAAGFREYCR
ncbi:hypothetical protein [Luedemannella helvata]|uniref:Lectin-like protein BA14k n=1 Tax=Luedemannella helvata TaxID=349315 RepID=A0ABN2KA10_9ACTN